MKMIYYVNTPDGKPCNKMCLGDKTIVKVKAGWKIEEVDIPNVETNEVDWVRIKIVKDVKHE